MKSRRLVPQINPCALIACIRRCIPDNGPVREHELRQWCGEMDAVIAEVRRADERRYEEREAA